MSDLPGTQRQLLIDALRGVSAGRQYANPLEDATPPALNKALKQVGVRSLPVLTECVASLYPDLLHRIADHIDLHGSVQSASARIGTDATAIGTRPAVARVLWQNLLAPGVTVEAEALTAHACIDFVLEVGLETSRTRVPEPTRKSTALPPAIDHQPANTPIRTVIVRRPSLAKLAVKHEPSRIVMPVQTAEPKPKRAGRSVVKAAQTAPPEASVDPVDPPKLAPFIVPTRGTAPSTRALRQSRITVVPIVDRRAKRAAKAASTQARSDQVVSATPALAKVRPSIEDARRPLGEGLEPPGVAGSIPIVVDATHSVSVMAGEPVGATDKIADASLAPSVESSPRHQLAVATSHTPTFEGGVTVASSLGTGLPASPDPISHLGDLLSLLKETPATSAVWDDLRSFMFDLKDAVRNAQAERTRAEHSRMRAPLANEIATLLTAHGQALREWGLSEAVDPIHWTASSCDPDECDATIALLGELRTSIDRLQELETSQLRRLVQRDEYRNAVVIAETRVAELVLFLGEVLNPSKPYVPSHDQVDDDPTDYRSYLSGLEKQADGRVARSRVGTLLIQCLFSEAAVAIRDFGDDLRVVRDVVEAMAQRLNFDIDGAIRCLDRGTFGRGSNLVPELRNELREMRPRNHAGDILSTEDQERLLAEVYWQADLAWRQGRMIDFVARIGGLVEQALLAETGRTFGRIFKSLDDYRIFTKQSPEATTLRHADQLTLCGDVFADLEKRAQRQRDAGNAAEADRLLRIHVHATRLDKVKQLRNRSCVAHGLERVTNSAIDTALDEQVGGIWRTSETRVREIIDTIPRSLFGSERVCWVAHEILRELGITLPDHNPLVEWGARLAGLIETID